MPDATLTTARLSLRPFTLDDAPFILELVNEPAFIANIRDSGVRTLADAGRYIADGPLASYAAHGFGLWCVEAAETGEAVGMCGLLKRDTLADPDIGFAFLERFRGRGYATEAAQAVMDWGRREKGLKRIVAITAPGNAASGAVLEKAGLRFEGVVTLAGNEHESRLYAWEAEA